MWRHQHRPYGVAIAAACALFLSLCWAAYANWGAVHSSEAHPLRGYTIAAECWSGSVERLAVWNMDRENPTVFPSRLGAHIGLQKLKLETVKAHIARACTNYVDPDWANANGLARMASGTSILWSVSALCAEVGAPTNYFDYTPWIDLQRSEHGWKHAKPMLDELWVTLATATWTNSGTCTFSTNIVEIDAASNKTVNAGASCSFGWTNGYASCDDLYDEGGGFDLTLVPWDTCPIWEGPWYYQMTMQTCGGGLGADAPEYLWSHDLIAEARYRASVGNVPNNTPPVDSCDWRLQKDATKDVDKSTAETDEVTVADPIVRGLYDGIAHTVEFWMNSSVSTYQNQENVGPTTNAVVKGSTVNPVWLLSASGGSWTVDDMPDCTTTTNCGAGGGLYGRDYIELIIESDGSWSHDESGTVTLHPAFVKWNFEWLTPP